MQFCDGVQPTDEQFEAKGLELLTHVMTATADTRAVLEYVTAVLKLTHEHGAGCGIERAAAALGASRHS